MALLLRRQPLTRGSLDRLEPASLGRDVRAATGPLLRSRALVRLLAAAGRAVTLALIDTGAVALAIYAGLVIRGQLATGTVLWGLVWRAEAAWLPFIALVMTLIFARAGLYRRRQARPGPASIIAGLVLTAVVVAAFARATGHPTGTYAVWIWTLCVSAVLIPALRSSFDATFDLIASTTGRPRRVVIVGSEDEAAGLAVALGRDEPGRGVRLMERVASIDGLRDVLARHDRLDDVVLAQTPTDDAALLDAVEACRSRSVHLLVVPSATRLLAREAAFVPGRSIPLFEIAPPTIDGLDWLLKRGFDLAVSGLSLLVLSPLLVAIAAMVKLTSAGPVLFRDERVGMAERPFAMLKFRSMRLGAELEQLGMEEQNEADGALFKIRRDPRLTVTGRVLRRLSLDELPQLINVLRGEMSLVGPRPLPTRDYERLADWHRKRYLVLPGITGLWQTSGRSQLTYDDMVRLDFYYLEHWSVWLDIVILARTPLAVLTGRGAY